MGKTLLMIGVIVLSILYTPVWVQLGLFVVGVLFFRFRLLFLIPAFFADAWYAPTRSVALSNMRMTLIVVGMILVWVMVMRMTRIRERYGLETK